MIDRLRNGWLLSGAMLCLSSCGETENPVAPTPESQSPPTLEDVAIPEAPRPPADVATADAPPEPDPVDVAARRADVLGFARYLPADVEAIMTFHHAKENIQRVREMEFWAAMAGGRNAVRPFLSPGIDPEFEDLAGLIDDDEQDLDDGETMKAIDFFGREVTLALGRGGAERIGQGSTWSRRSTYHQMRRFAALLGNNGRNEELEEMHGMFGATGLFLLMMSSPDIYPDLFADPIATAAMDAFQMPAIYMAVRASDGRVAEASEILSEALGVMTFFGEVIAPVEVERAGATFRGYRLIGEDIAKTMREGREFMEEVMGTDVIDRMIEFFSTRELVALSGVIDDYAVLFLGPSLDEFQLVGEPQDSLSAGGKLAFADPLLEHPFLGLMFGEKAVLETFSGSVSGFSEVAHGLRDGLAAQDSDGRNRDLVALLNLVTSREKSLHALSRHEASGVTAVMDGGLRIESHGGTNGMLDFSQPSRLAALGDAPDVAMFLHLKTDPRYRTLATAYHEALFETAYAILGRLSEIPPATDVFSPDPLFMFRNFAGMIEDDSREDLVHVWRAIAHDMSNGLGNEAAYVVDMKGAMPVVPGVPEVILKHGKAPRATMIAPVADRARIGAAWEKIQQGGGRLVTRIGTLREANWVMPGAIRSEAGDFSSWFLPLPYFNDTFLPSATLNDDWFSLGTSRNRSVEILQSLDTLETRDGAGDGLRMHVNFAVIGHYQREQLAMLDEHRDAILASEEIDEARFAELRESAETILNAVEQLDTLEIRCWEEAGQVRSSVHLRARQP